MPRAGTLLLLGFAGCATLGCHLVSGVGDLEFTGTAGSGATTSTTGTGGLGGSTPAGGGGQGGTAGSGGTAQAGAEP